jgi:uncharacterized hydrophobic protein (TIGR00271 family)
VAQPTTDTGRLDAIVAEALADGRFTADERRAVMSRLLPPDNLGAIHRYSVMLALSVTIAAVGLMANSAAVVIGAMLVAPLMTPIMAFATACSLGLPQRMARAAFMVTVSVIGSVLLAALLAAILPEFDLASEILARTRPDVRDLVVAIAAGAAGAYALAREDLSTSLPGVAVAVALVPPLATVGILMQRGEWDLAWGAGLLFMTNLVAIVVVSMLVLFATGVVPTLRLVTRHPAVSAVVGLMMLVFVAISIPLTAASATAVRESQTRNSVSDLIDEWIGGLDLTVDSFVVENSTVTVDLIGLDEPPRAFVLANELEPVLGDDAQVSVRWSQRSTGFAAAGQTEADSLTAVERVEPIAAAWMTDTLSGDYELLNVAVSSSRVVLEIAGPTPPEPDAELATAVSEALQTDVKMSIQWVQRLGVGGSQDPDVIAAETVDGWIGPRSSVSLIAVATTAGVVTVDLAAIEDPLGMARLVDALETRLAPRAAVVRVARLESPDVSAVEAAVDPAAFG